MNRQENKQLLLEEKDFGIANLHRDELRPSVRSYADNLREQIVKAFSEKGITTMRELEDMARGKIPVIELERINNLITRLSDVVKKGEVTEYEYKNAENNIKEDLKPVIKEWMKARPEYKETLDTIPEQAKLALDEEFLIPKIEPLLILPVEHLIKDKNCCQRFVTYIYDLLDDQYKVHAGILLSVIVNKSLINASDEELSKVYQELDLSAFKPINCIGYKLIGGKFVISGKAGIELGAFMKNGEIIADSAGFILGHDMSGGIIRVKVAWTYMGRDMTGGEISAEKCSSCAGFRMKGGMLNIGKADMTLGQQMIGGIINVKESGIWLGCEMRGGEINAEKAGDSLGDQMKGGKITIKRAEYQVGNHMMGGEIYIEKSYKSLDTKRTGGKIFFEGKEIT